MNDTKRGKRSENSEIKVRMNFSALVSHSSFLSSLPRCLIRGSEKEGCLSNSAPRRLREFHQTHAGFFASYPLRRCWYTNSRGYWRQQRYSDRRDALQSNRLPSLAQSLSCRRSRSCRHRRYAELPRVCLG